MSSEAKFVDGLRVYAPRDNAPSFVKANIVVNVAELQAWLAGRSGEVRIDIKESRGGKLYASENDYQPQGDRQPRTERPQHTEQRQRTASRQASPQPATGDFEDDDIPF